MSDEAPNFSVALVQSFYDRWTRLEEEKAATAADLKELFKEVTSNGLVAKDTRAGFRRFRALETDAEATETSAANVEMILAALAAPRVGARPARVA